MRSGALIAIHMPVIPPSDTPQNETRSRPSRSSSSSASLPSPATV